MAATVRQLAGPVALGAVMGSAWLLPGTFLAAALWFGSTFFLVHFVTAPDGRPLRSMFVAGAVGCCIAFHWLVRTIADFSGLPAFVSVLLYALFVCVTALQFVLYAFFARLLAPHLARIALATPVAWIAAETLMPRIFPWEPAHTQIAVLPLVQISDLAGSEAVGFLLFWICESILAAWPARRWRLCAAPLAALAAALAYGAYRLDEYGDLPGAIQRVALVQANVALTQEDGITRAAIATDRYIALTRQIDDPGSLIVWPESALQDFLPMDIRDRRQLAGLNSLFPPAAQMLVGTFTTNGRQRYNSAVAVYGDGRIPPAYAKRILMPFGEYMPLQSLVPQLASLNASFSPLDAGNSTAVFAYSDKLRASPLICYEDLVPAMSRDAVLQGATLLVNLTNDVWFGDTVAPRQHHLIASFRAIENRRWLLRATNTGMTAIVAPTGETVAALPGFSDGILRADVRLLDGLAPYSRWLGERLWWALTALACALAAWSWTSTARARRMQR
ncbi:MAG TPA: apolipoprotein N-acyltransferase [Burkholderiales bacterium]|nr:apolipoprotein N-acyltransferase [Burkholderiales bacterium]